LKLWFLAVIGKNVQNCTFVFEKADCMTFDYLELNLFTIHTNDIDMYK